MTDGAIADIWRKQLVQTGAWRPPRHQFHFMHGRRPCRADAEFAERRDGQNPVRFRPDRPYDVDGINCGSLSRRLGVGLAYCRSGDRYMSALVNSIHPVQPWYRETRTNTQYRTTHSAGGALLTNTTACRWLSSAVLKMTSTFCLKQNTEIRKRIEIYARKPCYRKETARCRSLLFPFKVRRHSPQV